VGARHAEEGFARFEQELARERAAALVRIASTLDALLQELADLRSELARASGPVRTGLLASHAERLREARRYRWYLEVQREAVGLRNHRGLDDHYRLPEPIAR
jgi:hypothetical protein